MRIFLDANILFSAAKSDGAVRELLARLYAGGHTLCVDAYVVAEARRNIEVKGAKALDTFAELVTQFEVAPFQAAGSPSDAPALLPRKRRLVLAAAIRLGCHVLVTGDRTHFGPLYGKTVGGVKIHSPRSLAQDLLS